MSPISDTQAQRIYLLIPTRSRTAMLRQLFSSLGKSTSDIDLIEAWIYVDEDDEVTKEFITSQVADQYRFAIHWHIGPRTLTMGDMTNRLWQASKAESGIYMPVPDDYVFATSGWDRQVRKAFEQFPDRIALVYPDDPTTEHEQVTFIILSAEWIAISGQVVTNYFPFWYDDTWLDQVAQLIQRKVKVDVQANPQGNKGKTIRMRNLLFWSRFFHHTLDERIEQADKLRQAIYPVNSPEYKKSKADSEPIATRFFQESKEFDVERIIYTERTFAGTHATTPPSQRYLLAEQAAVQQLYRKAGARIKSGKFAEAQLILSDIQYAAQTYSAVNALYAFCAWMQNNLPTARNFVQHEIALYPSHPLAKELSQMIEKTPAVTADHNFCQRLMEVEPIGVRLNPNSILQPQSFTGKIRLQVMPITLRLNVIKSVFTDHPVNQWPSVFHNLWLRFWRRRMS